MAPSDGRDELEAVEEFVDRMEHAPHAISEEAAASYWKQNISLMLVLLAIWFTVSFLFGIILAEPLNAIQIGGFKLGFWFAQQGAIYVFVALIFVYVVRMHALEKKLGISDDAMSDDAPVGGLR